MIRRSTTVLTSILVMLLLAGCASSPERELSQKAPTYAALPNGYDPLNPSRLAPMYVAAASGVEGNLVRHLERQRGHALNVLSLSGGGQNGAFGAGFLIGWRESGRRPEFDIVAGVSTGALLATHALLGTPADDAILEEMYTQVTKKNIFENRTPYGLLSGADSLRDTAPLRSLIAKHITAETLGDFCQISYQLTCPDARLHCRAGSHIARLCSCRRSLEANLNPAPSGTTFSGNRLRSLSPMRR